MDCEARRIDVIDALQKSLYDETKAWRLLIGWSAQAFVYLLEVSLTIDAATIFKCHLRYKNMMANEGMTIAIFIGDLFSFIFKKLQDLQAYRLQRS